MTNQHNSAVLSQDMINNKTDSIKVTKGMNNRYSFDVKIYTEDLTSEDEALNTIDHIRKIMTALKIEFEDNKEE